MKISVSYRSKSILFTNISNGLCHIQGAPMRAPPLSKTVRCQFHRFFAKNYSRVPSSGNCGRCSHDCSCCMHLSKFSSVDARSQKKGDYCILWQNLYHRRHRSPQKGQHCPFPDIFEHCVDPSPTSKNKCLSPL